VAKPRWLVVTNDLGHTYLHEYDGEVEARSEMNQYRQIGWTVDMHTSETSAQADMFLRGEGTDGRSPA
jgi:hypothetical protein